MDCLHWNSRCKKSCTKIATKCGRQVAINEKKCLHGSSVYKGNPQSNDSIIIGLSGVWLNIVMHNSYFYFADVATSKLDYTSLQYLKLTIVVATYTAVNNKQCILFWTCQPSSHCCTYSFDCKHQSVAPWKEMLRSRVFTPCTIRHPKSYSSNCFLYLPNH